MEAFITLIIVIAAVAVLFWVFKVRDSRDEGGLPPSGGQSRDNRDTDKKA